MAKMKLTRRQFLKSLLATAATAVLMPESLIEPVHGASDLTPQERDVMADVLGLRQEQWSGADLQSIRQRFMTIPVFDGDEFKQVTLPVKNDPGGYLVPAEYRDELMLAAVGGFRVPIERTVKARKVVLSWYWKGTSENGEIWSAEIPEIALQPGLTRALNRRSWIE